MRSVGMECSSNFRQRPRPEESGIKLTAAVNLRGVDVVWPRPAAQFWNEPGTEKCRCETARLKMLK